MWGSPSPAGRARGLPRPLTRERAAGGAERAPCLGSARERAAGTELGGRGKGRALPGSLPPSPDKCAAGRRRAAQPVDERGASLSRPHPVPRRAQRSLPAGPPRALSRVLGCVPAGLGGGIGLRFPSPGTPEGGGGRAGRARAGGGEAAGTPRSG